MNERYKQDYSSKAGQIKHDQIQTKIDQDHILNNQIKRANEILAKSTLHNLFEILPPDFIYTITRHDLNLKKDSDYQIKITNRNDLRIYVASTDGKLKDSMHPVGFCKETKILIKDKNEENTNRLIVNKEKLDELYQNLDKLHQTG